MSHVLTMIVVLEV